VLRVTEIFKSIQGESSWAGMPCVFVRLTGCPLRCIWCDTPYAYGEGTEMSVEDIIAQVETFGTPLVEITGGEPLAQPACPNLARELLAHGKTVLCETSGALPIDLLPAGVIRIMDLKCPGSGESERNDWNNIPKLTKNDEVKFVIADRNDYEWAQKTLWKYDLHNRCRAVLFSPAWGILDAAQLADWMLEDNVPCRLQLPLHKILWPEITRGR